MSDIINPWECEHEGIWQRESDEDYDEDGPHSYRCGDCDCEISVEYKERGKGRMNEDADGNHVFSQTFEKITTYYDSEE